MPVLKDFRLSKKINVPGYEGSEVEIYNSILAGQADEIMELQENPNKISKLISVLPKFIKSWNFTDDKNQILPITPENINLLDMGSLTFIIDNIKEFSEEVKKN